MAPTLSTMLAMTTFSSLAWSVSSNPVRTDAATPTPPVFPDRWIANYTVTVVQGPSHQSNDINSFFDGINNRTLQHFSKASMGIDTYSTTWALNSGSPPGTGQEFHIDTYGNPKTRHCEFWCTPTAPFVCDVDDSLCSYDYKNKAKFVRNETVNGIACNLWQWSENLGPIPMNSLKLWTDVSNDHPVKMYRAVHPFGKPIGSSTIIYHAFAAQGVPFEDSIFSPGSETGGGSTCQDDQPADPPQCP